MTFESDDDAFNNADPRVIATLNAFLQGGVFVLDEVEPARGSCGYCGKPLAFIGPDEDNSPAAMVNKCWGRSVDH